MIKTTLHINDMACGMCEAHINDAIRNAFKIKKVSSSHKKNITEILSEMPLDENEVRKVIGDSGYTLVSIDAGPYEKKGPLRRQ